MRVILSEEIETPHLNPLPFRRGEAAKSNRLIEFAKKCGRLQDVDLSGKLLAAGRLLRRFRGC